MSNHATGRVVPVEATGLSKKQQMLRLKPGLCFSVEPTAYFDRCRKLARKSKGRGHLQQIHYCEATSLHPNIEPSCNDDLWRLRPCWHFLFSSCFSFTQPDEVSWICFMQILGPYSPLPFLHLVQTWRGTVLGPVCVRDKLMTLKCSKKTSLGLSTLLLLLSLCSCEECTGQCSTSACKRLVKETIEPPSSVIL